MYMQDGEQKLKYFDHTDGPYHSAKLSYSRFTSHVEDVQPVHADLKGYSEIFRSEVHFSLHI